MKNRNNDSFISLSDWIVIICFVAVILAILFYADDFDNKLSNLDSRLENIEAFQKNVQSASTGESEMQNTYKDIYEDQNNDLSNCPCCGSEAYYKDTLGSYQYNIMVECSNNKCLLSTPACGSISEDEAIKLATDIWNKRNTKE